MDPLSAGDHHATMPSPVAETVVRRLRQLLLAPYRRQEIQKRRQCLRKSYVLDHFRDAWRWRLDKIPMRSCEAKKTAYAFPLSSIQFRQHFRLGICHFPIFLNQDITLPTFLNACSGFPSGLCRTAVHPSSPSLRRSPARNPFAPGYRARHRCPAPPRSVRAPAASGGTRSAR